MWFTAKVYHSTASPSPISQRKGKKKHKLKEVSQDP